MATHKCVAGCLLLQAMLLLLTMPTIFVHASEALNEPQEPGALSTLPLVVPSLDLGVPSLESPTQDTLLTPVSALSGQQSIDLTNGTVGMGSLPMPAAVDIDPYAAWFASTHEGKGTSSLT